MQSMQRLDVWHCIYHLSPFTRTAVKKEHPHLCEVIGALLKVHRDLGLAEVIPGAEGLELCSRGRPASGVLGSAYLMRQITVT